jgi:predicted Zn-dependent peptidase
MAPMGTAAAVAGLSGPDLDAFKKAHYSGNKMVISAAGAVDAETFSGLVDKSFGSVASTGSGSHKNSDAVFTGSDKRIRFDSMGDALVALAFHAAPTNAAEAVPFQLMTKILGEWDSKGHIGTNSASK